MSRRVLVLENDRKFAADLKKALQRQGVAVDVFEDGQQGIEHALNERPDLILISVELPKENGYLVCKKVKKHPFLGATPVALLSSSSDAEHLFSEHRKLRTQRADVYVKKPIGVGALLQELRAVFPVDEDAMLDESEDSTVAVDMGEDGFEEEATQTGARLEDIAAHLQHGHPPVDAEVDSFAENAFNSIVMEDSVRKQVPPMDATPQDMAQEFDVSEDLDEFIEDQLAQTASLRASSIPPSPQADSQDVRALRSEIADLRQQIADLSQKAARADRLESELRDAKSTRASKPAIGISSREYLDLREALNGKDKELLALRDQLSSRDKQLLELRDGNLQLERLGADYQDRIAELEDQVQQATDRIQMLSADKDAANKRAEDFKSRFERAEGKGKKLEQELETERQARVQEVQRVTQDKQESLAAASARHQEEVQRLNDAHASESANLRREHAEQVAALEQQFDAKTQALVQSHEELLSATREEARVALEDAKGEHSAKVARMLAKFEEEKESLRREEQAAKQNALDELRAELTGQMQRALREADEQRQNDLSQARAQAASELESTVQDLRQRHQTELDSMQSKHDNELAVLGRKLSETESTLEQTQQQLEQSKQQGSDLSQRLKHTSEERDRLSSELAVTQSTVEDLEQTKQEHLSRIDVLVAAQRDLESELTRTQDKIKKDEEILERARKALTIGAMLLDEQQKNAVQPG